MSRFAALALAALLPVSCAGLDGTRTAEPARMDPLLAELRVSEPPQQLPTPRRLEVERTVREVISIGRAALPALCDRIRESGDQAERLLLVRNVFLILEDVPRGTDGRAEAERSVRRAARELLDSPAAEDRYTGLLLVSLLDRAPLVPTLVEMLDDPSEDNRRFAADLLRSIAEVELGFRADAPAGDRRPAVDRWKRWWRRNRDRDFFYTQMANPTLQAFQTEGSAITRQAGPYHVIVVDSEGEPVPSVVVAWAYYFRTPDGVGKRTGDRSTTDGDGKVLLGPERMPAGIRFLGADVILSKQGYRQKAVRFNPHLITPNSYAATLTLEKPEGS